MTTMFDDLLNAMCREWYGLPGNGAGGALHIVLDDDNIETEHIVWCLSSAPPLPANELDLLRRICVRLLNMPPAKRLEFVETADYYRFPHG